MQWVDNKRDDALLNWTVCLGSISTGFYTVSFAFSQQFLAVEEAADALRILVDDSLLINTVGKLATRRRQHQLTGWDHVEWVMLDHQAWLKDGSGPAQHFLAVSSLICSSGARKRKLLGRVNNSCCWGDECRHIYKLFTLKERTTGKRSAWMTSGLLLGAVEAQQPVTESTGSMGSGLDTVL